MSGVRTGRICKTTDKSPRVRSRSVLKMMAVMQDSSKSEMPKEFLETGRTGRRNAMPDILHPANAGTSTADLPDKLQMLGTSDDPQPSTSKEVTDANLEDKQKGESSKS